MQLPEAVWRKTALTEMDIKLYFYRCTVHFEDSLNITPTNALLYHLLIKIA